MITSLLLDQPSIRHGFFTRKDGVSDGIYASLNVGVGSQDDPSHVAENRFRAAAMLDATSDQLFTPYQIHSPDAVLVDDAADLEDRPRADALVTRRRDIVIGIVTADCVPVLLADPASGVVAALHAGWKGTLAGIVPNTVATMEQAGADKGKICAAIGPCIAQASYEVGPEVQAQFTDANPARASLFAPSTRPGHFMFNLAGAVADNLRDAGVQHIDQIAHATYAMDEDYFSYRRATHLAEPDYGRQLSAIRLIDA